MNFQLIIYTNLLFFIIGIFGILYSRELLSIIISFHFIIISAILNFLSFSTFLYQQLFWDKIFIIVGSIIIYLIMFCLVYYINLVRDPQGKEIFSRDLKMFRLTVSDWWGEDKDNF
jgi:NADH:ubiquinone oxidoreductase subunit K